MQNARRARGTAALVLVAAATMAAAGGCGGGGPASAADPSTSSAADPALVAQVPTPFKAKGYISFATDASAPPDESEDPNTGRIIGFDVDLGTAIAAKLGLAAQFTNVSFNNILAGIQSDTYDAGMSSFTDDKDRENQGFEMVTYLTAGTELMVLKSNPESLSPTNDSLCGKIVAVETGTIQESKDLPTRSAKCTDDGRPPITTLSLTKESDATSALQLHQADAVLADSPYVEYEATQGFQAAGAAYGNAPYGIAVYKSNDALAHAFLGALKDLQADGTYQQLTSKWGLSADNYTGVGIDQATS